jgi:hypothetical protein
MKKLYLSLLSSLLFLTAIRPQNLERQLNRLEESLNALQHALISTSAPTKHVTHKPLTPQSNIAVTAQDGETIERKDFVPDILGIPEQTFRKKARWSNKGLRYKPQANGRLTNLPFDITNIIPNRPLPRDVIAWIKQYPRRAALFQGEFSYTTVDALARQINNKAPKQIFNRAQFTLRLHNPEDPRPTDIRFLQADPDNKYSSFQIASTFFGPLEGGIILFDSPVGYMNSHDKGMFHGAAQGEEASISAGAATLYRKYFMPTQRINSGEGFGYYYLLHDIRDNKNRKKLPWDIYGKFAALDKNAVQNYYPAFIQQDLTVFNNDVFHVGIGNHTNVVVTSGYGTFNGIKPTEFDEQARMNITVDLDTGTIVPEKTQLIHQIFSAAYSLRGTKRKIKLNEKTFARMVLQGSYLGNVKAAYLNALQFGPGKLFLTLMGAGAFENKIEWVSEAIKLVENDIINYGLDVILLYRTDAHKPHRKLDTDKQFLLDMITMMDHINGTHLSSNGQLLNYIDQYLQATFKSPDQKAEAQYANLINKILDPSY